jgi:Rrf2 family protein
VLSTTADHALRAVLFLGAQPRGSLTSAEEIARSIGAPANYLSKTLHVLAKAGILLSAPGRYGGFSLAMAPTRLTLAQVVRQFDGASGSSRCMLGDRSCNPDQPCFAHQRWRAINYAYASALESTTVADLIGG